MKHLLIVIDMQNDFIDGALGTQEALEIIPNVIKKIRSYPTKDIIATMDTHEKNYLETQEGQNLPIEHCIRGSVGWRIRDEIAELLTDVKIYEKPTFGSLELAEDLRKLSKTEEIKLELIGLCTDICVISNALLFKAMMPEVVITVDGSCCAGVTSDTHRAALITMQSCQIKIK